MNTFKSFGEQLKAVHAAAFVPERELIDGRLFAAAGMHTGIPSEGGFLVQQDFASSIWEKSYESGEILKRCTRFPVQQHQGIKVVGIDEKNRAEGSRYGGVKIYWMVEGDAITASKPKYKLFDLSLKKAAALVYTTDEMVQDAGLLEASMRKVLPEEYSTKIENSIVNGTGAGQLSGILNADCKITTDKETGQAAATIVAENIISMWSRFWTRSKRGNLSTQSTVWLIDNSIEPQLYAMSKAVGTAGVPFFQPANGAPGQPYCSLFGRPVIPVEYCKTLGTEGDIILADMSQYLVCDKPMRMDYSMHVLFIQGEGAFRFVFAVDGCPGWSEAITPASAGSTQSPFVTLQTRS